MSAILSRPQCVKDRSWGGDKQVQELTPVNSLAPGGSGCDSKNGIFNLILLIGIFISSHGNALRWMPQDLTDDKSTLVQVMAWCRQAPSHSLNQCWPTSPTPYGVTRPLWVNLLWHRSGSTLVQVIACYLNQTYHWWGPMAFTLKQFHGKCTEYQVQKLVPMS